MPDHSWPKLLDPVKVFIFDGLEQSFFISDSDKFQDETHSETETSVNRRYNTHTPPTQTTSTPPPNYYRLNPATYFRDDKKHALRE